IGKVVSSQHSVASSRNEENQKAKIKRQKPVLSFVEGAKRENQSPAPRTQHPAPTFVGREAELTQLHDLLDKALNGERQIVFVTGEAGMGKTAIVEAFLRGIGNRELGVSPLPSQSLNPTSQILNPVPWLGRGQCVEHYGTSEPYLPILEALGRLGRG